MLTAEKKYGVSGLGGARYVLDEDEETPPLLLSKPFAPFDLLPELEESDMLEACTLAEIQFERLAGVGVGAR